MTNFTTEIRQIEISSAINGFVQMFKNAQLIKDKTLVIELQFRVDSYSNKVKLKSNHYKNICLLYYCKYNYVTVCWTEGSSFDLKEKVNFEANHDSCWRDGTDRIIRKVTRELEEEILKEIKEEDLKYLHILNTYGMCDPQLMDFILYSGQECYKLGKSKIIRNI